MNRALKHPTFLMISPAAALIGVFIFLPMALTVWLSFHQWSTQTSFGTARFVGLRNYEDLFGTLSAGRDFRRAFMNTAIYTCLSVVVILPLSVILGLLVYQTRVAGGQLLRAILFSTYMVPMIAVALVWSKLYSPTEGPINQILSWFRMGPQPWLSSPDTALFSIVILNVWQQVGYFTVLAIAGMTQIPTTLYEAAKVDGANPVQEFVGVTLPLLKRTLLFSAVIAIINAVQVFEPVALITQGGPANATSVLTFFIRRVGIERGQGGLGSAMAVMLMLSLIVIIVFIFALAREKGDEK